ncbi:isocitrate lyase/phosphoenolpyruvate mutase family protein [Pseudonocardia sp. C8]|uniref:isocitrate lyase/PEP mutase family protein n=1 Tax=Pseudonocardia sp. C8 TaxID=2762759 RepID=UPI001642C931|nr:isocitrate lyase/phosphoenolpyruvate mutase family protein [Pseudonocardia sp. C8]MBC3191019.1 isocitrate lyase/phosphoenolpyruvate mutase family protein [Pseudonocardia sp. C8]
MSKIAETFRALHVPGRPLLMPNPWDAGSARLLTSLGFGALATTSGGHAGTLGRLDGQVARDEALAHAAELVAAVDVPVSADLENGFGPDLDAVRRTVQGAAGVGLAGCSIEDFDPEAGLYPIDVAAERVAAAVGEADGMVITARAENHLRGHPDLDDTIARLRAYADAGADVVYAPGLAELADIERVVGSVDRPVNVLVHAAAPTVAELASVGVARISVGSAFFHVAMGALARAGHELLEEGTYGYSGVAADGRRESTAAFS